MAARLATEFVLEQIQQYGESRLVMDTLLRSAVLQANLSHVMRDPELQRRYATFDQDPADELRRPISINALANSFGAPFETVRRRAMMMRDRGEFRLLPNGLIAPQSSTSSPRIEIAMTRVWTNVRTLYFRLKAAGLASDLPSRGGTYDFDAPPLRIVGRFTIDFVLRFIEVVAEYLRDPVTALVFMHLSIANIEHLQDGTAGLEVEGAAGEIPDQMRRPVTALVVSQRLNLPYETTRRRLLALQASGYCRRDGRGYVVPAEVIGREVVHRQMRLKQALLIRLFTGLAEYGVLRAWDEGAAVPALEPAAT